MIDRLVKAKAVYKEALRDYVTLSYCGFDDELLDKMCELDVPSAGGMDDNEVPYILLLVDKFWAQSFLNQHKDKNIRVAGPLAFPIQMIIGPDEVHTCTTSIEVDGKLTELELAYKPHPLLVDLVTIQGQPVKEFCAKHKVDLYRLEDDADAHYTAEYKAF